MKRALFYGTILQVMLFVLLFEHFVITKDFIAIAISIIALAISITICENTISVKEFRKYCFVDFLDKHVGPLN